MTKKLTAITPSYSSFKDDQVLTAGQLNELLNYFDDQERMTRISLSGVGIVCGFGVQLVTDTTTAPVSKKIIVNQGCGVTTDGDLLHLVKAIPDSDEVSIEIPDCHMIYTKAVRFYDEKAVYKPFFYDQDIQIPLWELKTADEDEDDAEPLASISGLENMVVVLYLESYSQNPELCTGISCDDAGVKEVQKLRVLITDRISARNIIKYDKIFNNKNSLKKYSALPDIIVPRVILDQVNTQSLSALASAYKSAVTSDGLIKILESGFIEVLAGTDIENMAGDINKLINKLFRNSFPAVYFQYCYDVFKDVVDTYTEMKELFLDIQLTCCPDISSFPKHLLLGVLKSEPGDIDYNNYRHSFMKSAILSEAAENYERFKSLANRALALLQSYEGIKLPVSPLKITPSKYSFPLGMKAIPCYYQMGETLLRSWDYEKTSRYKERRNLAYDTSLLDPVVAIQKPLYFNLEPYNFLDIGGLQGRSYQEAVKTINLIRQQTGLSFDVKTICITISSKETINIEDYPCEFADLTTLLETWRKQYECVLGNTSYYLSSYEVVSPWKNDKEPVFYQAQLKERFNLRELTKAEGTADTNVVYQMLDKKDHSVGKYITEAYDNHVGCSANDIINQTFAEMAELSFKEYSPFAYDLTVSSPVKLLAHSLKLIDILPLTLPGLTREVYREVSLNAANVCSYAKKVNGVSGGDVPATFPPAPVKNVNSYEKANTTQNTYEQKKIQGSFNMDFSNDYEVMKAADEKTPVMISTLMNELVDICCNVKQLEIIVNEIERRKKRILLNKKLNEFIKMHPGLEHFHGVKEGGTYVMVYINAAEGGLPADTVVADFCLPYMCGCKCEY